MTFATRTDRLEWLVTQLLRESGQAMTLPRDDEQLAQLFRALRNVRLPRPVDATLLQVQDQELQWQRNQRGTVTPAHQGIGLWQGDITRLAVDAIVNAANAQMLGCFVPLHRCIDNAIHSAAGMQLRQQCYQLMQQQGHDEPTGGAKLTDGFNLPARHVIHTVGPIVTGVNPTPQQCRQLTSCYRSCLRLAERHQLTSIALCCISTGEFRFPNHLAAQLAIAEVRRFMADEARHLQQVTFNVFKDEDYEIYQHALAQR